MKIFDASSVSKYIDKTPILKEISFNLNQGERLAIIGHNGSGKSSLLKLIGGIYEPTSGKVIKKTMRIGYVPEHFPENIRFRIMEYLLNIGRMSGNRADILSERINNFAKHFAINEFLHTPLKSCSKGTKQKVGIIQALLLEPELLLLDEPFTGLDEKAQHELLKQLECLSHQITIIFTAHDSLLIDCLASRVIKMASGKIIDDRLIGKKEDLNVITVATNMKMLEDIHCVSMNHISDLKVEITVLANHSDQILMQLLNKGCSILELKEKR